MGTCARHALYVEGDLTPRDRATLERQLETCSECQAFLRELEASRSALKALAAEPLPEGALEAVRARVLAGARRTPSGARAAPKWAWAAAAAAIAVLAVARAVVWNEEPTGRRRTVADSSNATPPGALAPPAAAPAALPQSQASPPPPPATATSGRPLVAARAPTAAPGIADLAPAPDAPPREARPRSRGLRMLGRALTWCGPVRARLRKGRPTRRRHPARQLRA